MEEVLNEEIEIHGQPDHHHIQKLSAVGLILLGVDQKDRRKKFISLSTQSTSGSLTVTRH